MHQMKQTLRCLDSEFRTHDILSKNKTIHYPHI